MIRALGPAAAAALVILALAPAPLGAAVPPPIRGAGGAVASEEPRATAVGLDVLRAGGNAVDAAVATALALAVVLPEAGNLGGGGFAVVRLGGEVTTLDFRETAPAAATRTMYADSRGEPVPDASKIGPLAAGVPGSPAGLHELHRRHGRLPWVRVVTPAARLAADGFRVSTHLESALREDQKRLARFPEAARLWLPHGEPLRAGTTLRLPDLAATLAAYAERGPAAVTHGKVAAAVEATAKAHGGVLTAADLAAYRPVWREPVRFSAFGWEFAAMGLPSSGGIVVGQTFGALERLLWGGLPRAGADRWHLLAETFRRSFADRALLGDPESSRATAADLLDAQRLDLLAASVLRHKVMPSTGVVPWAGPRVADPAPEGTETTHLSVIDREGNAVALTTTINDLFGCALYVPGAGFFLNNEMDDFATAPGRLGPGEMVQRDANPVAPGRRMRSSMSPVVGWRGGETVALGGRGGARIPTGVAQALLALVVDGDDLAAALARPRIHHQWLPDRLEAEADALSPETRSEIEIRGHTIVPAKDTPKLTAVRRLAGGAFEAATDPRGPAPHGGGGVVVPQP